MCLLISSRWYNVPSLNIVIPSNNFTYKNTMNISDFSKIGNVEKTIANYWILSTSHNVIKGVLLELKNEYMQVLNGVK